MSAASRTINLSIEINAPPSVVFAALIDLPSYNSWLPHSDVFKGTTEVSDTPLRKGSTYIERSPQGVRNGDIPELDEAGRHVVFHQPMKLKPAVLGLELDIHVDMRAGEKEGGGCLLTRQIRLKIPFVLGLAGGLVAKQFETESLRTLEALKAYLEERQTQPSS
jgi:hypothetical protein